MSAPCSSAEWFKNTVHVICINLLLKREALCVQTMVQTSCTHQVRLACSSGSQVTAAVSMVKISSNSSDLKQINYYFSSVNIRCGDNVVLLHFCLTQ